MTDSTPATAATDERVRAGKWLRPAADGCVDGHTFKGQCEMALDVPGPWDSTTMGTTG